MIDIISKARLDGREPEALARLVGACAAYDGGACIEEEKSLNAYQDMDSLFLAEEGGELSGLLSVFAPKMDEAEVGALVDPRSRRRGIFSSLLGRAESELLRFGYLDELFVIDGGSSPGKAVAAGLAARYEFTEFAMRYSGSPAGRKMPALELKRVGIERLEDLIRLRSAEFGDSREEAESFERATFAAPNRQVLCAFAEGRLIGACTIGFEGTKAEINGLVVAGAERGKGYGQAILGDLVETLSARGLEILLDVNSRNANALHIYEKAGFRPTMTKEYWRRRLKGGPAASLLRELKDYRSSHPGEEEAVDRIAGFVSSRPDAFSRSCLEGHVTGSAFVVDPSLERALFVHHAKLDRWLQPGGHCEALETAHEAAAREALEETGIAPLPFPGMAIFDLDVHEIPARSDAPAHSHYDVRYLFTADAGGERASEESRAVEWLSFEDAVSRNPEASIRRPLAKIEALRRRA
jgi:8-oxo-dGTP pyrophosphatase MutT (NUDIX family)/ribosomal protein S18 acetylase RimI-like enzyme